MRGVTLSLGLLAAVVSFTATDVRAGAACAAGCSGDLAACVQGARNDKLVCRADCRSNGGSGSCMRDCRVQGASGRRACRADAKQCRTGCSTDATLESNASAPACEGQCGQQQAQCLRDASAGLPACVDSCPRGSGRAACVKACQDIAGSGMAVCREQHQGCLSACAGATTTSTLVPSTTTVTSSSTTTVTSSSTTSSTVSGLCGNGVIDPGEQCDTDEFGDATCPGSSTGAFLVCTPECTIDFSQCPGAPTTTSSTVPPTTTSTTLESTTTSSTVVSTTTSTTLNLCGNGILDPGEECDTNEFGGATCPGSSTGAFLVCTPECTIDFSQCPGATTTSTIPGTSTSTSSSTTSTTLASTTSTSLAVTTTSLTTSTSSSTSTSIASTTSSSTSTSIASTTSSSTSTSIATTTSTTSSTSTTIVGSVLSFTTGAAGGTCGAVKSGGAAGDVRKSLTCGGLNVGGGASTVAEGPTPGGAETQMNVAGSPPTLTVSGRTAAEVGSNLHCSDTGCVFGPFLPIANAGTSTCVQNTFSSPASGTLDVTAGTFVGSFPLTSTVYLTANATSPCPRCLGGTPGVSGSGNCDPNWTAGGGPSPNPNAPCTPTDAAGDNYDCLPPASVVLPSFPVDLTPITTGTASKSNVSGLFCAGQSNPGAFGCMGSGAANAICPNGNQPPVPDYLEENGSPAGAVDATPSPATLASVFCIPSVGGSLGFLINGAANLPGPGATSLPGTLALLP